MKLNKKEWFRNMTNTAGQFWVIWIGEMQGAVFLHLLLGNSQCKWQVDLQNPHNVWMCENVFYNHRNSSHNVLDEYTKTVSNMPFVSVNVSLRVTPDLKVKMPLCWFTTMMEGQQTWDNFSTRFHWPQVYVCPYIHKGENVGVGKYATPNTDINEAILHPWLQKWIAS